jgi:hypothetical protein
MKAERASRAAEETTQDRSKGGDIASTNSPDDSLAVYARCWALHQALQLYQQSFLFPDPAWLTGCWILVLLLMIRPTNKTLFGVAMLLRNVARFIRCPFLWDSEFWLALTDVALLSAINLEKPLDLAVPWMRRQLAICYAAAAFFKLNTSFLNPQTSCAPIFVLSLAETVLPTVALPPFFIQILAQTAMALVITVEAAIAVLLLILDGKWGIWLALLFHLLIAVTPFPNGVPTFSCVAASRLFILAGNDGGRSAVVAVRHVTTAGNVFGVMLLAVVAVAHITLHDPAITMYAFLGGMCALALLCSEPTNGRRQDSRRKQLQGWIVVVLAAIYAICPPILGLQEIGSNTMFANMRLHGGSNHLLGIPTGLFQKWYYGKNSDWFGGGVVRVDYTNSKHLNLLYPGEITSLLSPTLQSHLRGVVGHVGRQFNPKARRVLGPSRRSGMPLWAPPFVKYTVPAIELRRLVAEARDDARETGQAFDLHFTQLVGATGDEDWRKRSTGLAVRVEGDNGEGDLTCTYRDETIDESPWQPCRSTELALLDPPPFWPMKFMLFYPYAILPDTDEGQSPDDLVCNY